MPSLYELFKIDRPPGWRVTGQRPTPAARLCARGEGGPAQYYQVNFGRPVGRSGETATSAYRVWPGPAVGLRDWAASGVAAVHLSPSPYLPPTDPAWRWQRPLPPFLNQQAAGWLSGAIICQVAYQANTPQSLGCDHTTARVSGHKWGGLHLRQYCRVKSKDVCFTAF